MNLEQRNAEIIRRAKAGERYKLIASDFGISEQQVSYIAFNAGITRRILKSAHEVVVLPTTRDTALANRGRASALAIAAAIGVSRSAIYKHWFRHGSRP